MQKLKKTLRLLALILFMVLASVGVGLTGIAPVFPQRKDKDAVIPGIEMVDKKEEEKEEDDSLQ